MKKTTVFISTAALMAGTACGVWAESKDTFSSSFDRMERSIYDSNYNPSPHMAAEIGTLYSANGAYADHEDAYAPYTTPKKKNDETNDGKEQNASSDGQDGDDSSGSKKQAMTTKGTVGRTMDNENAPKPADKL